MYEASILISPRVPVAVAEAGAVLRADKLYDAAVTLLENVAAPAPERKNNVEELDENFIVDNLRPVRYDNMLTYKRDIGFIAHEVQEIFPYLVNGLKDGPEKQSLNYIGLIGLLVKEIKDLKKENNNFKKEMDSIKEEITILKLR